MNLLKNKIAIITGAGKGIGKATAQQFQKEGAMVVIAESDKILGEKTADKIVDILSIRMLVMKRV